MIQIATTSRICEHLEKYVYDRIWNEPYTESRMYTKPGLLTATPASGFFSGRYSKVLLPPFDSEDDLQAWLPKSATKFFVYAIPDRFFSSAKINVSKWTRLSDYCTERCIDLHVFTQAGVILNRGSIYIKQADMNDCILMAVDAAMFLKLTGSWALADTVLFGNYIDSDGKADNKIYTTLVSSVQYRQRTRSDTVYPWDKYDSYLLYNGKLVTGGNAYRIYMKEGDYIEAVSDEDIVGTFDVDLGETAPIYLNSKDNTEWVVIHIPKAINPDHFLITPNTCDMWLVPTLTNKGIASTAGVYVYPCGREQYYKQLTHNDFAIDMAAIRRLAATNGFVSYYLKVFVRTHAKQSVVVRGASYVDMLYNLEDDEIIRFLTKTHPWQATEGEVAAFTQGVDTYWYIDVNSKTGWSREGGITKQDEFDALEAEKGTLYFHPYNSLLFWSADSLEECLYSNALIRRRGARYQDKATQCDVCGNTSCPGKTTPVTDSVCQRFVRTPSNQCSVCGVRNRCPLTGDPTWTCDCPYYHVRSIEDYIDILGYFHVLSLVGKRVWHFRVTKEGTHEYIVQAPLALASPELEAEDFFCLVYHNGYRIDQSRVSIVKTNRDNYGATELTHSTSSLSRSTLVIQSVYATRLKIIIDPIYTRTTDDTAQAEVDYYKEVGGVKVKATVVTEEEFEEMDPADRKDVDYVTGYVINKDNREEDEWKACSHASYNRNFNYYDSNKVFLVPGVDYVVGSPIERDDLLIYQPRLWTIVPEFEKDDTIAVEVFENRHCDDPSDTGLRWIKFTGTDVDTTVKMKSIGQWEVYEISTKSESAYPNAPLYRYTKQTIDDSYFNKNTLVLTLPASLKGKDLLIVDGPRTVDTVYDKPIDDQTFGIIGQENLNERVPAADGVSAAKINIGIFPPESEIIFVNNQRLVDQLDYVAPKYGINGTASDRRQYIPFIQNVSYLWDRQHSTKTAPDAHAVIEIVRTDTNVLGTQYGFLIGRTITWMGQAPFWFNELSTLTVGGAVCSDFNHTMGSITVNHGDHRNGAPYEVRTACSKMVMDIVGCQDKMEEDMRRILTIRSFFESAPVIPTMQTIIPHSHKIYSTYMAAIVEDYLTKGSGYDFTMLQDKDQFEAQFASRYGWLKALDVVYNNLSLYDLGFVDVYPLYHRTVAKSREDYVKLLYLNSMLSPKDNIKHKDAVHERY